MPRRLRRSTWLLVVAFMGTLVLYFLVRPAPRPPGVLAGVVPEVSVPLSTARRTTTTESRPPTTATEPTPTSTASSSSASTSTTTTGATPSSTIAPTTTSTQPKPPGA